MLHRFRSDVRLALALTIAAAAVIVPATAQASSPRLGTRTLRQGMTGPDVKTLQIELTKVGLKTDETGYFGPMTEGNVRKFESSHRLPVNGIVTQQFIRQLGTALAARTPLVMPAEGNGAAALTVRPQTTRTDPTDNPVTVEPNGSSQHLGDRTLREGMKGHDVRVLQGYLTLAGFDTTVDGDFGPATEANVIAFQLAHGMVGNGIFTYAESLVLRQAVATTLATPPAGKARINPDGTATAPAGAPQVVQDVIASANQIIGTSYCYAGGHGSWKSSWLRLLGLRELRASRRRPAVVAGGLDRTRVIRQSGPGQVDHDLRRRRAHLDRRRRDRVRHRGLRRPQHPVGHRSPLEVEPDRQPCRRR